MSCDIDVFLLSGNWSDSTKIKYRRILIDFSSSFSDFQSFSVLDFSDWLNSHPWGSSQKWIAYIAVRNFLRHFFGVSHPALTFKYKRKPSPPQRSLNLDQVKSLLLTFDTSTPKGRRDLAICSLFLDSGLRVSEVCNIDLTHFHPDDLFFDVFIKGGRWDRAIFSSYTLSCILCWLPDRSVFSVPDCSRLFISLGGTKPGTSLTRSGLQRIVFYWGKSIGIQLSPHDLRRTFATLATIAGAPSRLLQKAGRWSDISMVQQYTKSVETDAFRNYFPINFIMNE